MAGKVPKVVKCTIEAAEYAKIESLAKRMGVSPTKMASMLLQVGLEDNEMTIRAVTFIANKVRSVAESLSREQRKPAR